MSIISIHIHFCVYVINTYIASQCAFPNQSSLLGSFLFVSNTLGVMGLCPSKSPWPQTPGGIGLGMLPGAR